MRYAGLVITAFFLSLCFTPLARWIGFRFHAVDQPGGRRVNGAATPRTGGIALYLAFMTAFAIFMPFDRSWIGIALGATGAFLVGFLDDLFNLNPWVKLVGQVGAALIMVGFGVQIRCLSNPLGGFFMIGLWGIPLTVFWMVGMMNMINLIDGLDGLAAGVSAIAGTALFFVALGKGQWLAAALCGIVIGSACGFLVFNFNPARVFMGDGGALFLGYVLGVVSVQGALKSATAVALVVPLLALGVPLFDTFMAVFRRVRARRPVFGADREHLHHQLIDSGLSQRQAVLTLYAASGILGAVSVITALTPIPVGILILPVTLGSGLYVAHRAGVIPSVRMKR